MEKEIEIEFKNKKEKVILRKLLWGENNDCLRKSSSIVEGKPFVDMVLQHELRLLKSIVSAPFLLTLEGLRGLDQDNGDLLFNTMQEMNMVKEVDRKN